MIKLYIINWDEGWLKTNIEKGHKAIVATIVKLKIKMCNLFR